MLVEIFDRRDREAHYVGLDKLKKSRDPKTYFSEFLRISVMVPNLSVARRVYMFIDGVTKPLHGLVKYTRPNML